MKWIFLALFLFSNTTFAMTCFNRDEIRGYSQATSASVVIDGWRGEYALDLSYCSELPFASRIDFSGFSGFEVCQGDNLLVLDSFSNRVIQSCYIFNIRKY